MPYTRRDFLAGLALGAVVGQSSQKTSLALDPSALRDARRQATRRRRRVIFNNDGDDIWAPGADTLQRFLDVRHTPLLETHVDSIYYCTTQSFNLFTHDTRVAERFLSKQGQFERNNLEGFLQQGTDGLRMSSEFAQRHGLESFWTLRMNDIHDASTPAFFPKWKQQDPTRIMSRFEEVRNLQGRRRLWSLVDFEHPDVEPTLLSIISEVLENYELAGVELDFLRAPFYFRSSYEGHPATDEQTAVLTRLVRKIRGLVLRQSAARDKPLLLAVRVPVSTEFCHKIGIDIRAWLQEQLIDTMAIGGGYIAFDTPIAKLIQQAHQGGVPVYPCLSQSGLMVRPPRGSGEKQPAAAWFGAAQRLWANGADGIYTFNLFPGPGSVEDRTYARDVLTALGSRDSLGERNTMYCLSDAGSWMPSHYWANDVEEFSRALPVELTPREYTRLAMGVAEDLRGADLGVTAELRVDFTGLPPDAEVEVLYGSRNFGTQTGGQQVAKVRRFVLPVPITAIREGANRVMVRTDQAGVKLAGAELWIKRHLE